MATNKRAQREAARSAGNGFGDLNADDIPETSLNEIDRGLFGNLGSLTVGMGVVPTTSGDGTVQIGHFKLTGTGLVVEDDSTFDEWETLGGILHRLEGSIQWLIGDWLNYGAWAWGDKYQPVAEAIGYDEKTLRNYAWVARNVVLSLRKDKLSFGHHNIVAGFPADEQNYWLNRAVDEGLSIAKLRKAIQGGDALDDGGALIAPKTTKLISTSMREAEGASQQGRQHIAAMLEDAARQIRTMR